MKLLLLSLNYSPELTGIGKYNGEMCPEMATEGIDVTAIVAPPYYPEWKVHKDYSGWRYSSEIKEGVQIIRCPLYVPKNVTTIKRLVHLASFAMSSSLALVSKLFSKPDVIILVQPTLFGAPFVLLFSKLTGAKAIMHVQDFEIDAMFGLGMLNDGMLARIAKRVEGWLIKRFDAVSSISYSMLDNAKSKGVSESKLIHFPNWSDTEFVTPKTDGSRLRKEWQFEPEDKIILYAGNMGNKQGLEIVLEAAKHFIDHPHVKFVLVGTGVYVKMLESMCKELALTNVWFKPLQTWELVPQMLALAHIHLVVQKKGAADAVLPSKLTNILSVGGHTLVTTELDTELGRIAEQHPGIFECVEPENTNAFVSGLNSLLSKDLTKHNLVARKFAEDYLAKNKILDKFMADIGKLIA